MKSLLYISFILLIIAACGRPPELDHRPNIEFERIQLIRSGGDSDTLAVWIKFEDGDGDLGVRSQENNPPFHSFDFFQVGTGQTVSYSGGTINPTNLIKIRASDTLPAFNCDTYFRYLYNRVVGGDTIPTIDTLYIRNNPLRFNYYIDFFIKRNNVFEKYEFISSPGQCPLNYYDRFLPLSRDFGSNKPVAGSLRRNVNFLFGIPQELYVREDVLKVQIYIYDRSGKRSNIVESPEFTFKQIEK